ncbi:hypothetical protein J1614_011110 [Plenodomus biglobosus]|nr:hypothetical protein J1614_011110 [Plenodomus biglobosus]
MNACKSNQLKPSQFLLNYKPQANAWYAVPSYCGFTVAHGSALDVGFPPGHIMFYAFNAYARHLAYRVLSKSGIRPVAKSATRYCNRLAWMGDDRHHR